MCVKTDNDLFIASQDVCVCVCTRSRKCALARACLCVHTRVPRSALVLSDLDAAGYVCVGVGERERERERERDLGRNSTSEFRTGRRRRAVLYLMFCYMFIKAG